MKKQKRKATSDPSAQPKKKRGRPKKKQKSVYQERWNRPFDYSQP